MYSNKYNYNKKIDYCIKFNAIVYKKIFMYLKRESKVRLTLSELRFSLFLLYSNY